MAAAASASANAMQERVWHGRVPLQIVLSPSECRMYDKADPYLVSPPRVTYLPFLLPRLLAFFSSALINPDVEAHHGWFSFEGVPLKWHYPLGLLFDLYAGANLATSKSQTSGEHLSQSQILVQEGQQQPTGDRKGEEQHHDDHPHLPWRLTVHFSDWPDQELVRLDADGKVLHDAFINSVKEADFLRNGTAKKIMALSKEDSFGLWQAVQDHDFAKYYRIHNALLPAPSSQFRNVPLRIFLPSPPDSASPSLKVIQSTFPPVVPGTSASPGASGRPSQQQIQTIGTALNSLMPGIFPSRRFPVLAKPVLHGAVVPMTAPVEEVVRSAAYADGWLGLVVSMVI